MSVLYYNDSSLGWCIIFEADDTSDFGDAMWAPEALWIIPGTVED
jgi:hypothetical protein